MGKEIITFGNIDVEKDKLHQHKSSTLRCLINGGTLINFSIFFQPPRNLLGPPRLLIFKE